MKDIKPVLAYRFTKRTTLRDFYAKRGEPENWGDELRDISLILMVGHGGNGKVFCRIKCPVNPLPIIGWWETPDVTAVITLIKNQGWTQLSQEPFPVYLLN